MDLNPLAVKGARVNLNVIKVSSKTSHGIKMDPKRHGKKSYAVSFLVQARKNAYSKQSGWKIRLKKCSCKRNYATL
jgi:hypothetical protein